MTAHSKLGASSAHRWMVCAGSVPLSEGVPDSTSEHAELGSAAHRLAEICLLEGDLPMDYLDEGHPDPEYNHLIVDDDMVNAVNVYVEHILSYNLPVTEDTLEVQVSLEPMGDWAEGMFGTADFLAVDRNVLLVDDYKHGQGIVVEVGGNVQFKYYAAAALSTRGLWDEVKQVRTTVIQPRAPHEKGAVRPQVYPVPEIADWVDDELKPAVARVREAEEAYRNNDPDFVEKYLVPDEKACSFCRIKGTCPKLAEVAMERAGMEFNAAGKVDCKLPIVRLSAEQIASILDAESFFMKWYKAINETALLSLQHGKDVTGGRYKLVAGRSSRKWKNEKSAISALRKMGYTDEHLFKSSAITPAQAEKLVGKKQSKDLETLISVQEGKPTLAPMDDKRPALSFNPEDDFTD